MLKVNFHVVIFLYVFVYFQVFTWESTYFLATRGYFHFLVIFSIFSLTMSILSCAVWTLSILVPILMSLWILNTPFLCKSSCNCPIRLHTSSHFPSIVVPALCKTLFSPLFLIRYSILETSSETDAFPVPICVYSLTYKVYLLWII